MQDAEPLYDKTVRNLKNNKAVVFIVIAFSVVLGFAQFQGALSGLIGAVRTPKVEVQTSIRPYDFMGGIISSSKNLASVSGKSGHVSSLATSLADQIVSEIGISQTTLEATLQIDGDALRSSQPLQAAVLVLASPMSQMARISRSLGDVNGINMSALFRDTQFVNQSDNAIDMELVPQHGFFQRAPVKIFRRKQALSFEPDRDAATKMIHFMAHTPKVMLAFEAVEPSLENAKASLEFTLRSELEKRGSVELSPLTQAELDEQRKTIQHLGAGIAKSQLADKYNVDYIVTVKVLSD